jgi:hypothetical protein
MDRIKPSAPRRKWKRFKVMGGSLVLLSKPRFMNIGKPRLIKMGPIIDISLGGISLQYVDSNKIPKECYELSISVPPDKIVLKDVPFEILSDVEIAELSDFRKIRNRSVRFGKLSSYQRFQLQSFIDKYSIDDAEERRVTRDRRVSHDPRFEDPEHKVLFERRIGGDRRMDVL